MQYIPYNGTIYLHPYQTEWLNVSMELISTVSIFGYNYTIPAWLINAIILFASGLADSAVIIILIYFLSYVGIIGGSIGVGSSILWFIGRRMLGAGVRKATQEAKNVVNNIKPGNK
ncbi:MAG: hypothetical protein QXU98_06900, partial [Candidatus Parvarchaeota archaeon]